MAYSAERNVQMLIYLMKQHGIKRVIISPGATNITFVASIQQDPYFELYSSVDERSAAYMACGLATETGEPVALSCTGATASRNYYPALTEAFYRKLPILAITSTQNEGLIGQGVPQVIDRSQQPRDTVVLSVSIPTIQGEEDERYAALRLNTALLELTKNGGGPVHINLATSYSRDYSVKCLPPTRVIRRHTLEMQLPSVEGQKIAICVGAHKKMSKELTQSIETFCENYNAVVLTDHSSSYYGKYRVQANLILDQEKYCPNYTNIDLLIDIGEITGAYFRIRAKRVWRVSENGAIQDTYRTLSDVFQMTETQFFTYYAGKEGKPNLQEYAETWKNEYNDLRNRAQDIPFSNVWVAQQLAGRMPHGSMIYLGILNTLRSWNYFELPAGVAAFSNTGGFGIDGGVSSLLGASLVNPEKLYFAVVGDLGFFYDMNALGNRHVGANMRILVINNGIGTEFKNYMHNAYLHGDAANAYIAAEGHFGKKSPMLVKHFAEDLGFTYLTASSPEEFLPCAEMFVAPEVSDRPVLLEVFTNSRDESEAHRLMRSLKTDQGPNLKRVNAKVKSTIRRKLGDKRLKALRDLIKG